MFNKKIKTIVTIEGMSCLHCANKVKETLLNINDVSKVKVDLTAKEAVILSTKALDHDLIKKNITALDYQVVLIKEV